MAGFVLRNWFGFANKASRHARLRAPVALQVECLEDRWAPAILNVGPGEPFKTIQAAIDAAKPGDQVHVKSGTYQEQLTIDKSITLQGQDHSTIILAPTNLSAPGAANPGAIVRATGALTRVDIEHFTIEGAAGGTANLLYGVRVDGNAFAEIEHNTITNIVDSSDSTLGVAIDVGNSASSPDGAGPQVGSAEIEDNTISNYQRAGVIVNHTGSTAEIENNTITASATFHADSQSGVEVSDGAVAEIENNIIKGNTNGSNGAGIVLFSPGVQQLRNCHGDRNNFFITEVENNKISGNDYGIFGSQVTNSLSDQPVSTEVAHNQISGNTFVGIEFDNSSNVSIDNNSISGNGSLNIADGGIYLFQSTNNTLSHNKSTNNQGSGIYIDAGSTRNVLKHNSFKGNVVSTVAQSADVVDLSTGSGTAGTANTWVHNHGQSYITNSGQTVFETKPDCH
jgi:parallel beta-helix repeat protein